MRTDIDYQDFPVQFLVLTGILSTLISHSTAVNVTKGANATIPCTYGEGEVRNIFWYAGDCSTQLIVRYFKGNVASDETRFRLEADKSTLILENVTIADEGTYCCSVDIKNGFLNPYEFRTQLLVFGLPPTTLPVITQCDTGDHDDVIVDSEICTLNFNAPTNLTCELRSVYPNQSVKLEWRGNGSDTITDAYSNDDGTYTFVATIHVSESGSFWCNASFPSEIGQVDTGVQVLIRDPARTRHHIILVVCLIVVIIVGIILVIIVIYLCRRKNRHTCRRKQNRNANGSDADEQETGHEQGTEQTEEAGPELLPLMHVDTEVGNGTPDGTHQESHHNTDISRCTIGITQRLLLNLSKQLSADCFNKLCLSLEVSFNEGQKILVKNGHDYEKTFTKILMAWKDKTGGICHVLCAALKEADAGGFIPLIHNPRCRGIEEP